MTAKEAAEMIEKDFDRFIEMNMPLVRSIVSRNFMQKSWGFCEDEMAQEGAIGLIKAAKKYDPEKGEFSTYATFWIRSAILKYIAENTYDLNTPIYINRFIRKLNEGDEIMTKVLGRRPNEEEKVMYYNLFQRSPSDRIRTIDHLLTAYVASQKVKNLDATAPKRDGSVPATYKDLIRDRNAVEDVDIIRKIRIREILQMGKMSDRHRAALHLVYLCGWSMVEVSDEFRVTRQRAEQMIKMALGKIKPFVRDDEFKCYFKEWLS